MRRYILAGLIGLLVVAATSGALALNPPGAGKLTSAFQARDMPPDVTGQMLNAARATNAVTVKTLTTSEEKLSRGISRSQAIAIASNRHAVHLRSAVAGPVFWFAGNETDGLPPNYLVWGVTFDGTYPAPSGSTFNSSTELIDYVSGAELFGILCNPPPVVESC